MAGVPAIAAQVAAPTVAGAALVNTPVVGQAAQVAAPPTDSAYYSALQTALQPGFTQQGQQLAAQEAAMGTLNSGQGVNDFGQLAQDQNAIYAQQAAPMIDQGFQQQFSANTANAAADNANAQLQANLLYGAGTTNAGAINSNQQLAAQLGYGASTTNAGAQNSLQQLLQNQEYGAGINNANNELQANEFNSAQNYNLLADNQSAQNALQLAQLGYGNSDYLAQLGAITGLDETGLSSEGNILSSGLKNAVDGYQTGATTGGQAAQTIAANAVPGITTSGYSGPATGNAFDSYGDSGYEGPGVGGFDYNEATTSGGG